MWIGCSEVGEVGPEGCIGAVESVIQELFVAHMPHLLLIPPTIPRYCPLEAARSVESV